LNLQTVDGQDIFKKLIRNVDFVIESFSPGYLDGLGLDYDVLSQINPRLILTSITWFGRSGPKAGYKGSDLIAWAAGGELLLSGEIDQPPTGSAFPRHRCTAAPMPRPQPWWPTGTVNKPARVKWWMSRFRRLFPI